MLKNIKNKINIAEDVRKYYVKTKIMQSIKLQKLLLEQTGDRRASKSHRFGTNIPTSSLVNIEMKQRQQ